MNINIPHSLNEVLNTIQGGVRTGLKLAPAVLAVLLSTQAKAETWVCGIDIDENPDGTSAGTNINDGSILYGYVGHRGGDGVLERDAGSGAITIEKTSDGVSFTDITSNITSVDSTITSTGFDTGGYDPNTDRYVVYDFNNGVYWDVSNVSDSSLVSGVELLGRTGSPGSIDASSSEFIGSYYIDSSTYRYDIATFSSSTSPTVIYSRSGYDFSPVADIVNDRIFMEDSSSNGYKVDNISSSPSRTSMGVSNFVPTYFDPASSSLSGYDELLYLDNSVFEMSYCYDSDSAVATDTDGDGITDDDDACPTEDATGYDTDADGCLDDADSDGSTADADCDESNASVYPGATTVYDDGVHNDCDTADNAPVISSVSVSPSTVEIGNSVSLSVTAMDDESNTSALTVSWKIKDSTGATVKTLSGSSTSFTPSLAGNYTVTCTVSDGDMTSSEDSALSVSDVPVTYSELPTTDGSVADGTYYEDSSDPDAGSITVAGVSISGGVITLTGFGSAFSTTSGYHGIDYSAPLSGVSGETSDDWVGEGVMGFMAAQADEYPFADTEDTTKMFKVEQTAGTLTANGTYTNSDGSLELEETLTGNDEEAFADIIDDPDVIDTGDADTDTDSDSDTDSDGDTDVDSDADTDSGVTQDTFGLTDTGTPKEGCPGCATENGINGSFAVGALALAAMAARRRRNSSK